MQLRPVKRGLALAALLLLAPIAMASDDAKVEFSLKDANGKTVKRDDFTSEFLMLVYQGFP